MQKVKQQCKLHIVTLDYDWRKDNERNFRTETLKTAFLIACVADETKPEKNGLKYLPALLPPEFFMFVFLSVRIQVTHAIAKYFVIKRRNTEPLESVVYSRNNFYFI